MLRDLVGSIVWRHACLTYVRATTTTTMTTSNLAEHLESFGKKNTAFALQCGMHMLLFLGQAKYCVVLLRRSHCFRVKRDQEVRRVKHNVYRCFIVGRGAAAAADVASPVKSVPSEKRVSTSQATVFYSIIVRKRRDWKHG